MFSCIYTKDTKKKSKKWLDGYLKILNVSETIIGLKGTVILFNEEKKNVMKLQNVLLGEEISNIGINIFFAEWEKFLSENMKEERNNDKLILENKNCEFPNANLNRLAFQNENDTQNSKILSKIAKRKNNENLIVKKKHIEHKERTDNEILDFLDKL